MKLFGKDFTFNGNKVYHTGNKPTASEIGAAASSHTHNYAGASSASGNANAAVKLATARNINGVAFDGTKDITISTNIPTNITGLKELRFSDGACLVQTSGFAGLSISANPLKIDVSDFIISSPNFNLTSAGALSSKSFNTSSVATNKVDVYGDSNLDGNAYISGNCNVVGELSSKNKPFYGMGNIALASGSIYCGTIGVSQNCSYFRFNENILAGDNNKKIHLIDTAGNGASVYAGSVWANSGSWSDMSLKENIRRVANSEEKTANLDIINENQKTLDTSYDVTRPEMFDFIKDKLLLYLFNYKQLNENDEYEKSSFDNKIGFIANEISEDRVGKTFVGEQDGKLAYSLNNYVFLLTGALQEEIKRRELLEEKVSKLEKIIKQEKDGDF